MRTVRRPLPLAAFLFALLLAAPPAARGGQGDEGKGKPAGGDGEQEDEKDPDCPTEDLRAGKDQRKRFLLHGPLKGAKEPKKGYRLAVILPGGTGSADFAPFVRNILKHALGREYLVAQPIAVKWREDQNIVWPTKRNPVPKMEFDTEEFVEAVVAETAKRAKVDPRFVFTLSWSSSGPAAYAVALQDRTRITGSYVSMSVFFEDRLPSLKNGKGRPFYIEHSPEDEVCLFKYAEEARDRLKEAGAVVEFSTYPGGHGWTGGPVFPRIRKGFDWLAKQTEKRRGGR